MVRLALRFFGTPRLSLDRAPVKLDRRKAEALLAFLAVEPGEHRRSELALLFWPEQSTSGAKAALRRALCSLTGALERKGLTSTGAPSRSVSIDAYGATYPFSGRSFPSGGDTHMALGACATAAPKR